MSIEVILIPLGIAAFAAWRASHSEEFNEQFTATRITDQALLVEALHAIGATKVKETDERVTAKCDAGNLTFQRIGDNFRGRVDNGTEVSTTEVLAEIEVAVGAIVQTRSADAIRQRATELGLVLLTEHAQDGTIQFVFEEAS